MQLGSIQGSEIDKIQVTRAIISVFDKSQLAELCNVLNEFGVEIISTGGSAKTIRDGGLQVTEIGHFTEFPEILDGRVKTLHPKVHGGILSVRGNEKHEQELRDHKISNIDLVVLNLYPFSRAAESGDFDKAVENIDIGGSTLLRASAKNHKYVAILSNPDQYAEFMDEMKNNNGCISLKCRRKLALAAFKLSSTYEQSISQYLSQQIKEDSTSSSSSSSNNNKNNNNDVIRVYSQEHQLKYGCNPQQQPSAIYRINHNTNFPFIILNGTPGYINLLDACNAWQLVREVSLLLNNIPTAASFKHCSPSGSAIATPLTAQEIDAYDVHDIASTLSDTAIAYLRARNADPLCSFGDFAAISHEVDISTAHLLKTQVCDGIIAPSFAPEALEILKSKKKGSFIILQGDINYIPDEMEYREVYGIGFSQKRNNIPITYDLLSQNIVCHDGNSSNNDSNNDNNEKSENNNNMKVRCNNNNTNTLSQNVYNDMILSTITVKYTQSNSVGYAKNGQMIGIGAGQQSRVDCVKLAGRKVKTWYLRQHPKVLSLPFKSHIKHQDRVNARVRYIEGDITSHEMNEWLQYFESTPDMLTEEEKQEFVSTLSDVTLSSDAFFPFRDSIDHASQVGVKYIAQPGGSVADAHIIQACNEYNMTMIFTNTRLFHH